MQIDIPLRYAGRRRSRTGATGCGLRPPLVCRLAGLSSNSPPTSAAAAPVAAPWRSDVAGSFRETSGRSNASRRSPSPRDGGRSSGSWRASGYLERRSRCGVGHAGRSRSRARVGFGDVEASCAPRTFQALARLDTPAGDSRMTPQLIALNGLGHKSSGPVPGVASFMSVGYSPARSPTPVRGHRTPTQSLRSTRGRHEPKNAISISDSGHATTLGNLSHSLAFIVTDRTVGCQLIARIQIDTRRSSRKIARQAQIGCDLETTPWIGRGKPPAADAVQSRQPGRPSRDRGRPCTWAKSALRLDGRPRQEALRSRGVGRGSFGQRTPVRAPQNVRPVSRKGFS